MQIVAQTLPDVAALCSPHFNVLFFHFQGVPASVCLILSVLSSFRKDVAIFIQSCQTHPGVWELETHCSVRHSKEQLALLIIQNDWV